MENCDEIIKIFNFNGKKICFNILDISIFRINFNTKQIENLLKSYCLSEVEDILKENYYNAKKNEESSYKKEFLIEPNYYTDNFPIAELSFAPVHNCNLRCKYCFANSGLNFKGKDRKIDKKTIKDAIEFFVYNFAPNCAKYKINFVSGGEPFLNINAIENTYNIIESLKKQMNRNFSIWICTNGTIYNKEIKELFIKHHPNIGISLDGPKEIQDCLRPFPDNTGSYNIIIENMNKIINDNNISNNTKRLWGMVVINKKNYDLVSILKHHKAVGIKDVQMKIIRASKESDFGFEESDFVLLKEAYRKLIEFLIEDYKRKEISYFWMILNNNDDFGKLMIRLILKVPTFYRCSAARYKASVTANGDIYPCDSFVGNMDFCLGNIYGNIDETIRKKFFSMRVSEREGCRLCWARFLCAGDCYYNSYINTGLIEKADTFFCNMRKFLCELAIYTVSEMEDIDSKLLNKIKKLLFVRKKIDIS